MPQESRLASLKRMLTQVSPGGAIESLAPPPSTATEGPMSMPMEAGPAGIDEARAAQALEKLKEGRDRDLSEIDIQSLEAIVLPENRPVVFIRDGRYDELTGQWVQLNQAGVRQTIERTFASIGRIELPHHPSIPYGGTAFVVGDGLLMTNRHVAEIFAQGLGSRRLVYRAGSAAVDFSREFGDSAADQAQVEVAAVEMIHPFWDMAILRVNGLQAPALPLSVASPEQLIDRDVVVVGYPARDSRNDQLVQERVFGGVYNVKRLQPGKLRVRSLIRSFESQVNAVTHDCSTLGGNSGSAVIDPTTGRVVALHFAGIYLKANYSVPMFELARDRRVTALRLNFSDSVPATTEWDATWSRANGEETPGTAAPASGLITPTHGGSAPIVTPTGVSMPVQLWVNVSFTPPAGAAAGAATAVTPAAAPAPVEAPRMQMPVIFAGLENRKGYQDDFLGADVPLPSLTASGRSVAAKLDDGSHELKYHKFSVVMHRGRRLALYSAANVDFRKASREPGGERFSRKELTGLADGQMELWSTDWRIADEHQLPDVFFTKDGGAFDKGHLTRRDDVCWGTSFKDIQKGNGDTYHTPNCSPQVGAFNQATKGEDNWGDLENLVQAQTKAEKAVVISGPVLADDDPLFEGKDEDGRLVVRVPRRYWKIIVVKDQAELKAFAFVLEQDLRGVPRAEEFTVPAEWRPFMKEISELEDELGGLLDLSWFKARDQFGTDDGERVEKRVAERVGH